MGGLFDPRSISGLQAWYDWSDLTSIYQDTGLSTPVTADAQSIKGVTDKAGNSNTLTEATNPPVYKTNVFGSLGGALFDGAASQYVCSAAGIVGLQSGTGLPVTVIMAVKTGATDLGNPSFISWGNSGSGTQFVQCRITGSNLSVSVRDNASTLVTDTTTDTYSASTAYVLSYVITGTTCSIFINGAATSVASTALSVGAQTYNQVGIGVLARNVISAWYTGHIGAMFVYDSALSSTNRNLAEKGLGSQFGVTVS